MDPEIGNRDKFEQLSDKSQEKQKVWKDRNVRDQLFDHIQHDYLEAQVTQLRKTVKRRNWDQILER